MLRTIIKSGLGESSQVPDTRVKLLAEYGDYAQRVRDLAAETIDEQKLYIERFLSSRSASSPTKLFEVITSAYIELFLFDYAETHGPGSRRWMQFSLRSFLKFYRHQNSCYVRLNITGVLTYGCLFPKDATCFQFLRESF